IACRTESGDAPRQQGARLRHTVEYGEEAQRSGSGCSGARMPRYLRDGALEGGGAIGAGGSRRSAMKVGRHVGLQALIFFLVSSAFATIYITQPVLPVIRSEFGVSASTASLTVSAVIFGIALATPPFGRLVDTFPARPILFTGGTVVIGCSLFCAATRSLPLLVLAAFLQGLFIPSLTTCLVVYLVRSLPQE